MLRRAAAAAARKLQGKGIRSIAFLLPDRFGADAESQAVVEGVWMARFEPDVYKTEDRKESDLQELAILATGELVARGARRGAAIGAGQHTARRLAVEPGNLLTPSVLVDRARELADEAGLEIDVLDEERLVDEGFGALLGVAQGSVEPPALIVLRYRPAAPARPYVHLGLVGKAVTFDTGGISIKPAAEMHLMKYDMAGGAATLGAMQAIAALSPATTVTAFIPAVENMPGAAAQRPGDVVTTLSGKTVEVLNTDAEGRLILCDALTYALRCGANHLVDAATLTGSVVVALGHERSGLFANDEAWQAALLSASETAGEKLWPMPLDEEYREQLDSGRGSGEYRHALGRFHYGGEVPGGFRRGEALGAPGYRGDGLGRRGQAGHAEGSDGRLRADVRGARAGAGRAQRGVILAGPPAHARRAAGQCSPGRRPMIAGPPATARRARGRRLSSERRSADS